MKPLLRALLLLDALIWLVGAAFCLGASAAPSGSIWQAVVPADAVMLAQLFGVALLALVALRVTGAFNGFLTLIATRIVGHLDWISGAVVLAWLLAFHVPALTGRPQAIAALVGVVLIVLGLIEMRLALAIRRKQKVLATEAAAAARADVATNRATASRAASGGTAYAGETMYAGGAGDLSRRPDVVGARVGPGDAAIEEPARRMPSRWRPFGGRASDRAREAAGDPPAANVAKDDPTRPLPPL